VRVAFIARGLTSRNADINVANVVEKNWQFALTSFVFVSGN